MGAEAPAHDLSGNLADLVRDAARTAGGRRALVLDGDALTWEALDRRVDRCAAGLLRSGLATGDRVAVQLGNVPDFAVAYFGALRAGLVAVPVNTGATVPELRRLLTDSGAAALVTTPAGAGAASELVAGLDRAVTVVVTGSDGGDGVLALEDLVAGGDGSPVAPTTRGEDLAVVLYTSGTSGVPRGAMLSHRALLANIDQCSRIRPAVMAADDVVLMVLPLFHVYGLNAVLGAVAWHACTGVLVERFDPVQTLALVRREQVTNLVAAPPLYVAWSLLPDLGDALTGVRLALSGASPLPAAVLARMLETSGHHVFEGYGLTETSPVLTSTLMSEVARPDSIGRPVPGVELRLLDVDGRPVEDGDPGEVVVRGANLFSGYWPDAAGGPDAQGWFATGDVALQDAAGDLRLVDRRRELVLVSGFNVYPREVEEVLTAHPDVEEAAVLGIAHPYTGETVKALVVLRDGATVGADELIAHCARSLARFKCPTAVELVTALPHSATGKVSKGRLRELAG